MVPEGITSHESRLHSLPEQVGKANFDGGENRENQENVLLPEIRTKLSDARWNESFGNQQEELQKSEKFLVSLPEPERETIFQIIQQASRRNFDNYIKENGYIINVTTLQAFKVKFGNNSETRKQENQEAQTEEEKIQTEEEKIQKEKENNKIQAEKDLSILNGSKEIFLSQIDKFSHIPNFHEVVQKLQNANPENPEEIQSLNEALKTALAQNFEKVAKVYEELGRQENPSNPFASAIFQNFEKQALAINPSFSTRLESYKSAPKTLKGFDPLHQAQIVAGLGSEKYKKYGNIAEATVDGKTVRLNLGETPPVRSIALEGSSYQLGTDLPIGDFYSAISSKGLAYEKTFDEKIPQINILEGLQSREMQEFVKSEDFQKESYDNIVRIIAVQLNTNTQELGKVLGLIGVNDKEGLKSAVLNNGILSQKQKKLEKEIAIKKEAYQKALKQLVAEYSRKLQERDKKAEEVLIFFKSIGFDMIPQSITDDIFKQLNSNPSRAALYGFNKLPIDFANGNLGIDLVTGESQGLEMPSKIAFAEFINAMLGSEVINIENLQEDREPIPTKGLLGKNEIIQAAMNKSGILNAGGITRVWENIDSYYASKSGENTDGGKTGTNKDEEENLPQKEMLDS